MKYPEFAIPTGDWLKKLYDSRKQLDTLVRATGRSRPAFAVWGPSQTGKSTLMAAFLDELGVVEGKRRNGGKLETSSQPDGSGGALHWTGGDPALFMSPYAMGRTENENYKAAPILNPFNSGKDASACLTRFVMGSLQPGGPYHHVFDPKHPVQVRLVSAKELLHAVARGFDTECWGHQPTGSAKSWEIDKLIEDLNAVPESDESTKPDEEAYALMHDFCEVLDDLVFAGIPRFRDLAGNPRRFKSTLSAILSKRTLISDRSTADDFIARVLWESCEPVTGYYEKMRAELTRYEKEWAGKTIFCGIPTATLLLDMDIYEIIKSGAAAPPKDYAQLSGLVRDLSWRDDGQGHIIIGVSGGKRLFEAMDAEKFAIFQGLVWEIVVPLNPDNLPDSAFRRYMQKGDLLDFPGVGRKIASLSEKIRCECRYRVTSDEALASISSKQDPKPFTPDNFFVLILKRGKTASIISGYAKALTIDGFAIFTNLDGDPIANAEQLQTGIFTWWHAMVPHYFKYGYSESGKGSDGIETPKKAEAEPSPLPLILGLLWWPVIFRDINPAAPSLANFYRLWEGLGKLADPNVVTSYALNYHTIPKGKIDKEREQAISKIVEKLKTEDPAFKKQFNTEESRRSFDEMWNDRKTGGATFFFEQLLAKVGGEKSPSKEKRIAILEGKRKESKASLQDLLDAPNLFPPPEERDPRAESLREFRAFLASQISRGGFTETRMRAFNYALRIFLNVNPDDLAPIPRSADDINDQFVADQFQRWVSRKVDRYRETAAAAVGGAAPPVDWTVIGVSDEVKCRDYLTALANSISPRELVAITKWLRELVQSVEADTLLEPYLAVRMSNAILYESNGKVPIYDTAESSGGALEPALFTGVTCPSYKVFVRDFIKVDGSKGGEANQEPKGRLTELIEANLPVRTMPVDLPGVEPLRKLCDTYKKSPKIYTDKPA